MATEPKEASTDQYAVCEECSKEEGTKVYWHKKRGLKKYGGFLSEPHFECPNGHRVKVDGA